MKVSKNPFYYWLKNKELQSIKSTTIHLMNRINFHFTQSKEIYGSHRIQKMLEREGLHYHRSYIAILMKKMGLKSVLKRKFVVTTNSKHSFHVAEKQLNREFNTLEIGKK